MGSLQVKMYLDIAIILLKSNPVAFVVSFFWKRNLSHERRPYMSLLACSGAVAGWWFVLVSGSRVLEPFSGSRQKPQRWRTPPTHTSFK